jgi:uncharacterized protein YjbJ (UPF0337 family)
VRTVIVVSHTNQSAGCRVIMLARLSAKHARRPPTTRRRRRRPGRSAGPPPPPSPRGGRCPNSTPGAGRVRRCDSGGEPTGRCGQPAKGAAKENLGKATYDEQMEREGQSDRTVSNLKQAGEKVKDAFKKD